MEPRPGKAVVCSRCNDTGWRTIDLQNGRTAVQRCDDDCPYYAVRFGVGIDVPAGERDAAVATIRKVEPKGKSRQLIAGVWTEDPGHAGNIDGLTQVQHFIDGAYRGLYLWGLPGRGKTKLACAALNGCMKRRQSSRFVRVPELLMRLPQDDDTLFDALIDVPVLCLDDVGAQQGTDYARRTLQALFDARESRDHRTIWTSNLDLDDLARFLQDDRLSSRIADACKIVEVGGPDHRLDGHRMKSKQKAGQQPRRR